MFSSSGFTEGATQYATHHWIDLFQLTDLDDAVLEGFIRSVELNMRLTVPHVEGTRLLVAEALPNLASRFLFQENAQLLDRSGTANFGNAIEIINRDFGAKLEDRDGSQTIRIDFPKGSHLGLGAKLVAVDGIEVTGYRTVLKSSFKVDLGDTVRAALDNIVTRERLWLRHDGTLSEPAQKTIKPVD